jgi:hypothetical protein
MDERPHEPRCLGSAYGLRQPSSSDVFDFQTECPLCANSGHSQSQLLKRRQADGYSVAKSQQAIRDLVKAIRNLIGNMPSLLAMFPNRTASVVRIAPDCAREPLMMRWGFSNQYAGRDHIPSILRSSVHLDEPHMNGAELRHEDE